MNSIHILYDPTILLQGIHTKETHMDTKRYVQNVEISIIANSQSMKTTQMSCKNQGIRYINENKWTSTTHNIDKFHKVKWAKPDTKN